MSETGLLADVQIGGELTGELDPAAALVLQRKQTASRADTCYCGFVAKQQPGDYSSSSPGFARTPGRISSATVIEPPLANETASAAKADDHVFHWGRFNEGRRSRRQS
ncbi:hypothetical protein [Bradyrhizobium sp. USDA 4518]